jgi:hypothetical protein
MSERANELADRLRKGFAGPLSAQEIEFLGDAQAFIEFSIRNGLSFPTVVANLGHDLNDLSREMFDLPAALAKGFRPKVAGYSKLTPEDFGDSEEPRA